MFVDSGISITVTGTGMQLLGTTQVKVVLGVATFDNLWVVGQTGATGVVLTFNSSTLIPTSLQILLVPGKLIFSRYLHAIKITFFFNRKVMLQVWYSHQTPLHL
jgi:hypothetical protein